MDQTRVLLPITTGDGRLDQLRRAAVSMRDALETKAYDSMEAFLVDRNCTYEYYLDVIRSSIRRPTVMLKRSMSELWTNPFNPWIGKIMRSNMDLQFVLEEFSCAAYVVEYVNKTNRGISSLHRELIKLQEEHPDHDYNGLLKKVSIKMLNSVEMSAQEAAWYLLRQPMSEASRKVLFCLLHIGAGHANSHLFYLIGGIHSDDVATRADQVAETDEANGRRRTRRRLHRCLDPQHYTTL